MIYKKNCDLGKGLLVIPTTKESAQSHAIVSGGWTLDSDSENTEDHSSPPPPGVGPGYPMPFPSTSLPWAHPVPSGGQVGRPPVQSLLRVRHVHLAGRNRRYPLSLSVVDAVCPWNHPDSSGLPNMKITPVSNCFTTAELTESPFYVVLNINTKGDLERTTHTTLQFQFAQFPFVSCFPRQGSRCLGRHIGRRRSLGRGAVSSGGRDPAWERIGSWACTIAA